MTGDRNARIQERAYHLWLGEGRPHGKHEEHWRRAERELIEAERGRREGPSVTASREEARAAGIESRQDPVVATAAAAGRSRTKSQASDQPKAGSRARSSRPAATGSGSRSIRRSAAAKSAE